MRRSNVFNVRYPRPLDRELYKAYAQFVQLKQEIAENWKTEIVGGMAGLRGYHDFADCRLDVTNDGVAVMRVLPVLGEETMEELNDHVKFFLTYSKLTTALIEILGWAMIDETIFDPIDLKDLLKQWKQFNNPTVHKLVMTLKILVTLKNFNKLQTADLYRFEEVFSDNEEEFVASMNALVREHDLGGFISSEFQEGKAHFYQYPDSDLVQAYWTWVRQDYKRNIQS